MYDEGLSPDWTLANSNGFAFEVGSEKHPREGRYALEVQPQADSAQLHFALRNGASAAYPRDQVLGVRFWLYSGTQAIGKSELGMAVVGSNQNQYWLAGDDSVPAPVAGEPTFSETRLSFLGINRAIPPETWVQVDNWLDERQYDPDYAYVTGFYIKAEKGFTQVFYIDKVELILLPERP